MTYRQLAAIAGVSVSTVSRALSGSDKISDDTLSYIRNLAEKYNVARPNYRRNNAEAYSTKFKATPYRKYSARKQKSRPVILQKCKAGRLCHIKFTFQFITTH